MASSSSTTFDVIVIGAGIMGISTGLACVEAGQKCLVLEQFPYPHCRGSSTGHSRITRQAYRESAVISKMMLESHSLWRHIETETGSRLYNATGCMYVEPEPSNLLDEIAESMSSLNYSYQKLDSAELVEKYGNAIRFPHCRGLLDPTGGVLRADLCNSKSYELFIRLGGRLVESAQIESINAFALIEVRTRSGNTYFGRNLVIAAGSWSGDLLRKLELDLPLHVEAVSVCFWRVQNSDWFSPSQFPCIIDLANGVMMGAYSMPCTEYPGLIKLVHPTFNEKCVSPELRDLNQTPVPELAQSYYPYLSAHYPGLVQSTPPCIVERCLYTKTPDEMWIIDRHPKHPNVVILAGFSGHGFKAGPVIGKVASEMVTGGHPEHRYDMSVFSMRRFQNAV